MANTYKTTKGTYGYSVSDTAKDKLQKASGLTFRAINTTYEENSAKNRQNGQWEEAD